jgi:hypothetical protein
VRILLDESVPHDLVSPLAEHHEVETAQARGWGGAKNGELLRLVSEQAFDAFITCDQNLPYQQNLGGMGFGIVVLAARDNRPPTLLALMPQILGRLRSLASGEVVRISDR